MEILDVFTLATLALLVGGIIGLWLGKMDARLQYHRGRLDGINLIWEHYVALMLRQLLSRERPAGDKADGGDGGARPPV